MPQNRVLHLQVLDPFVALLEAFAGRLVLTLQKVRFLLNMKNQLLSVLFSSLNPLFQLYLFSQLLFLQFIIDCFLLFELASEAQDLVFKADDLGSGILTCSSLLPD